MQHELQTLTVISSTFHPELIGTIVTRVSEIHGGHYNVVTHTGHIVTFDTFFDSTVDSYEYEDAANANLDEQNYFTMIDEVVMWVECIFPLEDVLYVHVQSEFGNWVNVPFNGIGELVATRKVA